MSLDFISFQLYGGLFSLPEKIEESGFDEPFMVTEWGTIGYWGMETTVTGAPAELTSSEKADIIKRGHDEVLSTFGDQLIGHFIFLWGQKQERTHTWFGLLMGAPGRRPSTRSRGRLRPRVDRCARGARTRSKLR